MGEQIADARTASKICELLLEAAVPGQLERNAAGALICIGSHSTSSGSHTVRRS